MMALLFDVKKNVITVKPALHVGINGHTVSRLDPLMSNCVVQGRFCFAVPGFRVEFQFLSGFHLSSGQSYREAAWNACPRNRLRLVQFFW